MKAQYDHTSFSITTKISDTAVTKVGDRVLVYTMDVF